MPCEAGAADHSTWVLCCQFFLSFFMTAESKRENMTRPAILATHSHREEVKLSVGTYRMILTRPLMLRPEFFTSHLSEHVEARAHCLSRLKPAERTRSEKMLDVKKSQDPMVFANCAPLVCGL